jgi:allophanate hydrolase subunit 2
MPGNVQVPADGQLIIVLVEQTIGGYAKVGTVITPDLFKVAQAKPGDIVRFSRIPLDAAHKVLSEWSNFLANLEEHITGC